MQEDGADSPVGQDGNALTKECSSTSTHEASLPNFDFKMRRSDDPSPDLHAGVLGRNKSTAQKSPASPARQARPYQ